MYLSLAFFLSMCQVDNARFCIHILNALKGRGFAFPLTRLFHETLLVSSAGNYSVAFTCCCKYVTDSSRFGFEVESRKFSLARSACSAISPMFLLTVIAPPKRLNCSSIREIYSLKYFT